MRSLTHVALAALVSGLMAGWSAAEALRGPELAAAANFSQGRQADTMRLARSLGVDDFRDGTRWREIEPEPGRYVFDDARARFPDELGAAGAKVSLVMNWGNPIYQNGETPTDPDAVAAFGALAGALAERFPSVTSLEIGNEFNGVNFVRGPIRELSPLDRARAYVPLLTSAAEAARERRSDIRILGGATHSIPAAYIWAVLDAGGGEVMDALAIHPYTTEAEQLVRQIAVLRRHPAAAELPIEITEFGEPDPEQAAGHFVRNYCQMSLSGVTRAVWYPFNERGDDMVPLISPDGRITSAGRAWRLIAEWMEGRPVVDAAPDPFGYGCRFGDDVLVLWGSARPVVAADGVTVLDAEGNPVPPPHALSPEAPLVFVREAGDVEGAVTVAPSGLVADSFHQYAYPRGEEALAEGDAFERFARRDGQPIPLVTLPGQERGGVPWTPYRGGLDTWPLRLTATSMLPSREAEIVHRFVAPEALEVKLEAHFDVSQSSKDGIAVTVTLNGERLAEDAGSDRLEVVLPGLALSPGDALEIAVGQNGSSDGDLTSYRITLRHP